MSDKRYIIYVIVMVGWSAGWTGAETVPGASPAAPVAVAPVAAGWPVASPVGLVSGTPPTVTVRPPLGGRQPPAPPVGSAAVTGETDPELAVPATDAVALEEAPALPETLPPIGLPPLSGAVGSMDPGRDPDPGRSVASGPAVMRLAEARRIELRPFARFDGDALVRLPETLQREMQERVPRRDRERYRQLAATLGIEPVAVGAFPLRQLDGALRERQLAAWLGLVDRPARRRLTQAILARVFAHLPSGDRQRFGGMFGSLNDPIWDIHERARRDFLAAGGVDTDWDQAVARLHAVVPMTPAGSALTASGSHPGLANLFGLALLQAPAAAQLATELGVAGDPTVASITVSYRGAARWHLDAVRFLLETPWLDGESLLGRVAARWQPPAAPPVRFEWVTAAVDAGRGGVNRGMKGRSRLPPAVLARWATVDGRPARNLEVDELARLLRPLPLPDQPDHLRVGRFDGQLRGWSLTGWIRGMLAGVETLEVSPILPLWGVTGEAPLALAESLIGGWARGERRWRRLGSGLILTEDEAVVGLLAGLIADDLDQTGVGLFPETALSALEARVIAWGQAEQEVAWAGRALAAALLRLGTSASRIRQAVRQHPDSIQHAVGGLYYDPLAPIRLQRLRGQPTWDGVPGLRLERRVDLPGGFAVMREFDLDFFARAVGFRERRDRGFELEDQRRRRHRP